MLLKCYGGEHPASLTHEKNNLKNDRKVGLGCLKGNQASVSLTALVHRQQERLQSCKPSDKKKKRTGI